MNIHPKTAGAAFGTSVGVVIVGILQSIHGVHMASTLPAGITGLCTLAGSVFFGNGKPAPTAARPVPQVKGALTDYAMQVVAAAAQPAPALTPDEASRLAELQAKAAQTAPPDTAAVQQ